MNGKHRPDLYETQKVFFQEAYRSGKVGWPRTGASRLVLSALEKGYLPSRCRVLEIGCGEGRNLSVLQRHGCRVVGMDYVLEPLRSARNLVDRNLPLIQGDLLSLPFRDGSFDAFLDWGVFHHLRRSEREQYPLWVSRLAVPGAVLLLGAFSEKFRHHPDEVRRRTFVRHRGHYDVFFTRERFSVALGNRWKLLWSGEEDQGDGLSYYRLGIFRYEPPATDASG
jgi:SAM-dependent methyltransferase